MNDSAQIIRDLAAAKGTSLRQLAAEFSIPYRTMQDWSTGKRKPPDYVIKMMQTIIEKYPNP